MCVVLEQYFDVTTYISVDLCYMYMVIKSVLYTLLLWNAPHTRTDSPEAEH